MSNPVMKQPTRLNLEGLAIFPVLRPLLNELMVLPPDVVMINGPCKQPRGTVPSDAVIVWTNSIIEVIKEATENAKIKNFNDFVLSDGRTLHLTVYSISSIIWNYTKTRDKDI